MQENINKVLRILKDGRMFLPHGTTAERSASPEEGEVRGSSTYGLGEIYLGGRWVMFGDEKKPVHTDVTGPITLMGNAFVPIDTSAGSFTVTLNTLALPNDHLILYDVSDSWLDHPLTIDPNGMLIDGDGADVVVEKKGGAVELVRRPDGEWNIINSELIDDPGKMIGRADVVASRTLEAKHEYAITANTDLVLTLPATAQDGNIIRIIDLIGVKGPNRVKVRSTTNRLDGDKDEIYLGNKFGSMTLRASTREDKTYWMVVAEHNYDEKLFSTVLTAASTLTTAEDVFYPVDTESGGFLVTLPVDPRPGQELIFLDVTSTWGKEPFMLDFGAKSSNLGNYKAIRTTGGTVTARFSPETDRWQVSISNAVATPFNNWVVVPPPTTTLTLVENTGYRVMGIGRSAATTLTLPILPTEGAVIMVTDITESAEEFNITIINDDGKDEVIDRNGRSMTFTALGQTWFKTSDTGLSLNAITGQINSNVTLDAGPDILAVDTRTAAVTVTLSNDPDEGDIIWLTDSHGDWYKNPLTIARNGKSINGTAANLVVQDGGGFIGLAYDASMGWRTIASSSKALEDGFYNGSATITTNTTAVIGTDYSANKASGSLTLTLPDNPPLNSVVALRDTVSMAPGTELRIAGNQIVNKLIITEALGHVAYKYIKTRYGNRWVVTSSYGTTKSTSPNTVLVVSSATTLARGVENVDLSGVASNFTLSLPSTRKRGDRISITNIDGSINGETVTISGNGLNIVSYAGTATTYTANVAHEKIDLVYDGTVWRLDSSRETASLPLNRGKRTLTTSGTINPGEIITVNNTAAITLTIANGQFNGQKVMVFDGNDNAKTSAITVSGSITGDASITENGDRVIMEWHDTSWIVLSKGSPSGGRGGSSVEATVLNSNVTAPDGTSFYRLALTADRTLTLGSINDIGDEVFIYDINNTLESRTLTIGRASGVTINGTAANLALNAAGGWVHLVKTTATNWDIIYNSEATALPWTVTTSSRTLAVNNAYRLTPSAANITLTLPTPNKTNYANEDRIFVDYPGADNNHGHVKTTGGSLDGTSHHLTPRSFYEFRVKFAAGTYRWYVHSEVSGSNSHGRSVKTSDFTAYGPGHYLTDFSANATIRLNAADTALGDTIIITDIDGGWANKTITIATTSGSFDNTVTSKTISRGFARLVFMRVPTGWHTISEHYEDFVSNTSATSIQKLNEPFAGLDSWTNISANTALTARRGYNVTSRTNAITVTLPSAASADIGDQIAVVDRSGNVEQNRITINGALGDGLDFIDVPGGMTMFECRYTDIAATPVKSWIPVTMSPVSVFHYRPQTGNMTAQTRSVVPVGNTAIVSLPSGAKRNGDTVTVYEHGYRDFLTYDVTLNPQGTDKILGATGSMVIPSDLASITLIWSDADGGWNLKDSSLRVDKANQKLDLVTGIGWTYSGNSNVTAVANNGYVLGDLTADRTVTLPATAEVGDTIAVGLADNAVSGHAIIVSGTVNHGNGEPNSPISVAGDCRYYTYINATIKWVVSSPGRTNEYIETITTTVNLSGNTKTWEKTLTAAFTLTAAQVIFPSNDNVTTFFLLFRQNATGGHDITLPPTWKQQATSESLSTDPNAYNLIQGVNIKGTVFYSVSVYF